MNIRKYINSYRQALTAAGMSQRTIDTYSSCLGVFLKHFQQQAEPKDISGQQIQGFIIELPSPAYQRQMHGALKNFYKWIIRQPNKLKYVPFAKADEKLPVVLSIHEIEKLLLATDNLKHKTILSMIYACGMRISEAINCTPAWINRQRMVVDITGKGNKQRQVPLSPKLLRLLETYWRTYEPKTYLFEGQKGGKYSTSSIQNVIKKSRAKARITKHATVHSLRHSYATHLLEAGTDLRIIQMLLGHKNVKTTERYAHVTTAAISQISQPFAQMAI